MVSLLGWRWRPTRHTTVILYGMTSITGRVDVGGVAEVAAVLGVSRQQVANLRQRPDFPAPMAVLSVGGGVGSCGRAPLGRKRPARADGRARAGGRRRRGRPAVRSRAADRARGLRGRLPGGGLDGSSRRRGRGQGAARRHQPGRGDHRPVRAGTGHDGQAHAPERDDCPGQRGRPGPRPVVRHAAGPREPVR